MSTTAATGQTPLPPFAAEATKSLAAIFDTIVPPGEFPGGWGRAGVEKLLREHLHDFLDSCVPTLRRAVGSVDSLSMQRHAQPFRHVSLEQRASILRALLEAEIGFPRGEDRAQRSPIESTIELRTRATTGARLGRPAGASWASIRCRPVLIPLEPSDVGRRVSRRPGSRLRRRCDRRGCRRRRCRGAPRRTWPQGPADRTLSSIPRRRATGQPSAGQAI